MVQEEEEKWNRPILECDMKEVVSDKFLQEGNWDNADLKLQDWSKSRERREKDTLRRLLWTDDI